MFVVIFIQGKNNKKKFMPKQSKTIKFSHLPPLRLHQQEHHVCGDNAIVAKQLNDELLECTKNIEICPEV